MNSNDTSPLDEIREYIIELICFMEKKMTRKAIVAMVGESWIDLLSLDEVEKEHDNSCGGGGSCGSTGSGCGCRVSGHPFRAAVPENLKLRAGDTVEVSASAAKALGASVLVLGFPIFAAAAGWLFTNSLFPGATEVVKAGSAALGLAGGAGLAVLSGKLKKENNLPEITSVLG
ncbi:MAG: hypothetical protein DRZ90_15620 [Spirochaetes bacterium]|nr:MAG: hypothetical protein DRZ90_15620 [Spirochaetota bacterium]